MGSCGARALPVEGQSTRVPTRSCTASFPVAPGSPEACLHVHFVGSIPLPDAKTVLRTLADRTTPGVCRTARPASARPPGCAFCSKAIEVASDVPSFEFTQWDASYCAKYSTPALEAWHATRPDDCAPTTVKTHYADMAIESSGLIDRLQQEGAIPAGVKFQISLATRIAPTYNNVVPTDRPALITVFDDAQLGARAQQKLGFSSNRPPFRQHQARSKRSKFMTLFQAATKSRTNLAGASS